MPLPEHHLRKHFCDLQQLPPQSKLQALSLAFHSCEHFQPVQTSPKASLIAPEGRPLPDDLPGTGRLSTSENPSSSLPKLSFRRLIRLLCLQAAGSPPICACVPSLAVGLGWGLCPAIMLGAVAEHHTWQHAARITAKLSFPIPFAPLPLFLSACCCWAG